MKMTLSVGILFLVMALAISAISFALGWYIGTTRYGGWIRGLDYAHLDYPPLVKTGAEKRILSLLEYLRKAPYNPPLAKTEAEKRILSVLEDLRQGPGMGGVAPVLGRLLRILVEAVDAKNVVEIGTSSGYSALWFCLGLQTTNGRLITYEIDPKKVSIARANFERAGVEKIVTVVVGDAHETVTKFKEPIDILFLDADKPGFLDYLNKLLPLVRPGGLILTDAANNPSSFPDFIKAITTNQSLETIGLNMRKVGISLTLKKR
jgi:predicted O-methyltransferase YrrM